MHRVLHASAVWPQGACLWEDQRLVDFTWQEAVQAKLLNHPADSSCDYPGISAQACSAAAHTAYGSLLL